ADIIGNLANLSRWILLKNARGNERMIATKFLPLLLMAASLFAAIVERPHIIRIAHMAYYVSDLNKARNYYEDFLGFEEAFRLKNPDGAEHLAFIKINDQQFIELVAEAPKNHGFLRHVAFETDDARGMRAFLTSVGVKVPGAVTKDQA